MSIFTIQQLIKNKKYFVTAHAVQKMVERNIDQNEIEEAVLNGEIIEYYPKDKYSPSCLIFGKTRQDRPIHVVCSLPPTVWIITVYEPDKHEWINSKIRREVK